MIEEGHAYEQDGLCTLHNHEFMDEPAFQSAYARGIKATGMDFNWHWRVHVGLWAAQLAVRLEGDFVECGVGRGFLSSSIMAHLDWNALDRTFYLLDTFSGIDERYVSPAELADGAVEKNGFMVEYGFYAQSAEPVVENFAEWRNVRIIVGPVPETLHEIAADTIAYLHLDMNCAPPEIAAIDHLWDRLVVGAPILLDDYAYIGYRHQKLAMDDFAARKGVHILSLPTGQGLIVKPPRRP